MKMKFLIISVYLVLHSMHSIDANKLEERFVWKEVEFDWPSDLMKEEALNNGSYVVANNLPLGLERWNDKLFITVPRYV